MWAISCNDWFLCCCVILFDTPPGPGQGGKGGSLASRTQWKIVAASNSDHISYSPTIIFRLDIQFYRLLVDSELIMKLK